MAGQVLTHSHSHSSIRAGQTARSHVAQACALVLAQGAALAVLPSAVLAQQEPAAAGSSAQTITITGRTSRLQSASISGFGDTPLSQLPLSATVINMAALQDAGIASLADLTRLSASASDAYNPTGYWSQLAVRGYTLDNRFNYRRDGLPINAETRISLANKQALELMQGTSGLQAGTSAPGGLVNLVVKRPTAKPLREASLSWEQPGSVTAAFDLSDRTGGDGAIGWRLNASASKLSPQVRNAKGSESAFAGAVEWRLGTAGLLEAEMETSRHSQPSVPGFSLLGHLLPAASSVDPRLNLNNQSWSLPVVFKGNTGSLRYSHILAGDWKLSAHVMRQALTTEDRVAFPFGCSAVDDYSRYCADGTFDLYDYRSEGERRNSSAAELAITGKAKAFGADHALRAGVLSTRYQQRLNRQAYNWVGNGNINGSVQTAPDPSLTDENTQRTERSTEFFAQDHVQLNPAFSLWLGLRHTALHREAVRTDGSRATAYDQSFTTPWLAASYAISRQALAYASIGKGVESEVAPGRSRYINAGKALPALTSKQSEIGIKLNTEQWLARAAWFNIQRPTWADFGACSSTTNSCERKADGSAHHQGLEAEAEWRGARASLRASAMWLKARREGSQDAAINGLQPPNVPATNLKLQGAYSLPLPGLAVMAFITHEGRRQVLPDNTVATPGFSRLDLALRYTQHLGTSGGATNTGPTRITWRLALDNATNARAWKEAPFQFDHSYLYPLAPRTWHASVQVGF